MRAHRPSVRSRNDPAQYDDLAHEWASPRGAFAALHWLARARAELVPPPRGGAVLIDVGCGAGLLAPWVQGYRHVGVDITTSALQQAKARGVEPLRADAAALPLRDGCAGVVVAGEILEHVTDLPAVVAELCRVLRPGGVLVVDTLADSAFARFALVTVGERLPGGPPRHIHDPALFVSPARLTALCADHGVHLLVRGLRPDPIGYVRWLVGRAPDVRMVPVRSTAGVYQGRGVKAAG